MQIEPLKIFTAVHYFGIFAVKITALKLGPKFDS